MFWLDPSYRIVAVGCLILGVTAGSVGCLAVVRQRSLIGDAVSHAALPGVAIAYLLGGRSPVELIIGGSVAGWVAMIVVQVITAKSKLPYDATLAGSLAVFFGFGVMLMTYMTQNIPDAANHGIDRYLLGQAALMNKDDLYAICLFSMICGFIVLLLWKEFKLLCFDSDYASAIGRPIGIFDLLLSSLIVVATVLGIQAVGVVLMSAMLVAPAVAARLLVSDLRNMVLLAGLFGGFSAVAGTAISHFVSESYGSVPTGPAIVLVVTSLVAICLLFQYHRRKPNRQAALGPT